MNPKLLKINTKVQSQSSAKNKREFGQSEQGEKDDELENQSFAYVENS